MSNIYIQEPSTTGKVLLKTTVGDIEIELWTRECPKTCRNFIQLCMEGYYNGTVFHRVVKGFIVQGGDPSGDGTGGESIYGEPFKDEFHSRLRYSRRGLVGMANSDKDDNGSQFFFTMAPTPELQNKNTLFGKITGDTVFNMLKLEDGLVDHNERPLYAQKIIRAEILSNPFDDIVPRMLPKDDVEKKEKKKSKEKGVKNFGLLSFGEEAEEDEEETNDYVQRHSGKAKSMHDMVDDPKLSKQTVKITRNDADADADADVLPGDNSVQVKEEEDDADQRMHRIKSKLKQKSTNTEQNVKAEMKVELEHSGSEDEDLFMKRDREEKVQNQKKKDEIRQEILSLKKQYQKDKKIKEEIIEKSNRKQEVDTNVIKNPENNEFIQNFIEEKEKYSNFKSKIPKKGAIREDFTLNLLSKFRSKLDALKQKRGDKEEDSSSTIDDKMVEKEIQGDDWLAHTLKFQDIVPVLAKDASTKGDDWYDAYDPRNPLNKRKRGESGSSRSNSSAKRSR